MEFGTADDISEFGELSQVDTWLDKKSETLFV